MKYLNEFIFLSRKGENVEQRIHWAKRWENKLKKVILQNGRLKKA